MNGYPKFHTQISGPFLTRIMHVNTNEWVAIQVYTAYTTG